MPIIVGTTVYFTVEEFRNRYPDLTSYTDEQIEEHRAAAEEAFEDAAGVAFIPRARTITTNLAGRHRTIVLPPRTHAITAASTNGADLTASELAGLTFDETGVVYNTNGWFNGLTTVTIEHGYASPPLRVKQAVMLLTKAWMVTGPVDERATSMSTEDGVVNLMTPGLRGQVFGIPEVDATLDQYAIRSYIA